jgi:sugar phosphate isomerase/epimerase
MRLGVVGLLPRDFRTLESSHLQTVREMGFTGGAFHLPGELCSEITPSDTERCRTLFSDHNLDLVQFSITYAECLFDPDPEIRKVAIDKIEKGAEIAAGLSAHHYLLRPGSLNPAGSWTPHRDNHTPEAWDRLIETLKEIAPTLEQHNVTVVMETHLVSILKNPEMCQKMVENVGSPNLRLVLDYVNHFETLTQVYASAARFDHIFSTMGSYSPVMHIKDITIGKGLVIHLNETVPGNGELDLAHCFQCFQNIFPDRYGLIEHLKPDLIPEATSNTRAIASQADVPIV